MSILEQQIANHQGFFKSNQVTLNLENQIMFLFSQGYQIKTALAVQHCVQEIQITQVSALPYKAVIQLAQQAGQFFSEQETENIIRAM